MDEVDKWVEKAEGIAERLYDKAERWVKGDGEGEGAPDGAPAEPPTPPPPAAEQPAPPGELRPGDQLPARQMLPARLERFAPPDPAGEARTRERLEKMTVSALRTRRGRIDRRLHELGLAIGEPALEVPSVRGTGLFDLDRVLRKIDRLDDARDLTKLERDADRAEKSIPVDLDWLTDVFRAREIRTRRDLLVAELGLALCACDHAVLGEYAPHVKRIVDVHLTTARRIDELLIEARLVDEEFERRAREGLEGEEPKQIDRFLNKALDQVDDVSTKVGGTVAGLGVQAVATGGKAIWGLTTGAAKGAWALSRRRKAQQDAAEVEAEADALAGLLPDGGGAAADGPRPGEIPALVRELGRLRDEGLLTEREFAQKKAELLKRL